MGIESIVSILIACAAAAGVLWTNVYQRHELRGKTKAEQESIVVTATSEAVAAIKASLGGEVDRLSEEVKNLRVEVGCLRDERVASRERMAVLEAELRKTAVEKAYQEDRILALREEITRLGGDTSRFGPFSQTQETT